MTDGGNGALRNALARLGGGADLSAAAAAGAVAEIIDGGVDESLVAAFLAALQAKGVTPAELAGAVEAVRARMAPFEVPEARRPLVDTCGTGGDGARSVNVSTGAAIVAAAAGAAVAKHGNRSATGNSGSAEVLAALGVAADVAPALASRCLAELGLAFLYAPRYHPALKHAAAVRRKLPFRTLFNLVGPLANPARPEYQLVGASATTAPLLAEALAHPGTRRAAIVAARDGLDEVSLGAPTDVLWVEGDSIERRTWLPADFGLAEHPVAALRVTGPVDSAARLVRALVDREPGPVRDVVLANAAAALVVAGLASGPADGVARARQAVDSGAAARLLADWRSLCPADGPA